MLAVAWAIYKFPRYCRQVIQKNSLNIQSCLYLPTMWAFSSDSEEMVSDLEFSSSDSDEFESGATSRKYFTKLLTPEEVEFITFHRVTRKTFVKLVRVFQNSSYFSYQTNGSNGKLQAADQLSAFLRFAGHDAGSFREIARTFEMALSSLHRIINRFTYCFSNMSQSVIKWPTDALRDESERHFKRKGFPGVIGVLGYGHVQIDRPFTGSDSYVNNDNRYSIQIQIICNHKCKIIDVFVGYPGAAQPVDVLNASPLSQNLEDRCISGAYRILASNDYPSTPYLITPYEGELNESQQRFNNLHHESSFMIHQCFALLHQKFRQLGHIKLKNLGVVTNFVRACCVLHNLSLDDELPPEEHQRVMKNAEMLQGPPPIVQVNNE